MTKSYDFYGIRGTHVFFTVTVIIFSTFFIWTWDKTPLVGNLKISWQQYDIHPAGFPLLITTASGLIFVVVVIYIYTYIHT